MRTSNEDKEKKVDGYCGWRWVELGGHVVKRIVVVAGGMAFILPQGYKNGGRTKQARAIVISAGQVFKTQADAKGGVDRDAFVVRGYNENMRYERVKVRGSGELNPQNYAAVSPTGELQYIHTDFMGETEAAAAKYIVDQIRETLVENTAKDRKLLKVESAMRRKIRPKKRRRR